MPEGDSDHRVEFFVGLLPERDDVASPLAGLALYVRREQVAVGHGHTVAADGPLAPGTNMRRFIVMRPRAAFIEPLKLRDGTHVEFLQAIPIFEFELAFKAVYGADALLEHWESVGVPFWDPSRRPEPE